MSMAILEKAARALSPDGWNNAAWAEPHSAETAIYRHHLRARSLQKVRDVLRAIKVEGAGWTEDGMPLTSVADIDFNERIDAILREEISE